MKKITIVLTIMLGFFAVNAQDKEQVDYQEAFQIMNTWLDAQVDFEKLPGISTGIVIDDKLVWSNGFGFSHPEKELQTKTNTIYSICSISKLFTSIAIMQLRDAGKLSLESKISDLLPWYDLKQQYKESGPITVRSLLTHSSGLPRESAHSYWSGPDFPFPESDEIKKSLKKQSTLYPASTYFQYSNLAMSLLGEIVTEVSGLSFDKYINDNILSPLRLADTQTYLPKSLWGTKMAMGYGSMTRDGKLDAMPFFQAKGIAPAAGFSSTVEDLARFASWQFRLLEKDGEEILKSSTLKEMHQVHWMDPDWKTTWGLGFSIREHQGRSMVGHGGSCPGYRTVLTLDPKNKTAYIVMINTSGASARKYAKGLQAILEKAKEETEAENDQKVNLKDYSGIYDAQPWGAESVIVPWKGHLGIFYLPTDNPAEGLSLLQHVKDDTFRRVRKDETLGEEISFERDKSGKVIRMVRYYNHSKKIRELK